MYVFSSLLPSFPFLPLPISFPHLFSLASSSTPTHIIVYPISSRIQLPIHPSPFSSYTNATQGLTYLTTPNFPTSTLSTTHPTRPMTLYRGPNSLFRALGSKYRLNKAEYLQIYNLRPSTQVMLECVVEEVRRFLSIPLAQCPISLSVPFTLTIFLNGILPALLLRVSQPSYWHSKSGR